VGGRWITRGIEAEDGCTGVGEEVLDGEREVRVLEYRVIDGDQTKRKRGRRGRGREMEKNHILV